MTGRLVAWVVVEPEIVVDAFALVPASTGERRDAGAEREGLAAGTLVGGRYRVVSRVGVGAFDRVARRVGEARRGAAVAIAAALVAAFCYSIASQYAKSAKAVPPFANAHGSMWAATLFVIPAMYSFFARTKDHAHATAHAAAPSGRRTPRAAARTTPASAARRTVA
mgnify:CR=1 FL=1